MPVMIDRLSSNIAAASADINSRISALQAALRQAKDPAQIQQLRQQLESLLKLRENLEAAVASETVRLS